MRNFKNVFCWCLILVLPISYYADPNDSSSIWFRLGGGTGQYSTVIKSCNNPPEYLSNDYSDIGGALEFRPSLKDDVIFGIRGGHLSAGIKPGTKYGHSLEHGYINPYVSVEKQVFGAGIGLVRNLGPRVGNAFYREIFEDHYDIDPKIDFRYHRNNLSGHVRLGSLSSIYGIVSLYEGVPIVSRYGYFLFGLGYGSVPDWHFTSGLSLGFYDQTGFYLGVSHDMKEFGRPEFAFRLGSAQGDFEGGFSVGWAFTLK